MKLKIVFLFSMIASWILTVSYLNGPAQVGGYDRTGSPLVGGAYCGECHDDIAFNPSLTAKMFDNGMSVDIYEPGKTYQLEIDINIESTESPGGYGVQAVSLDVDQNNLGKFSSIPAKTQLSYINGYEFFEHGKLVSRIPFELEWTAPPKGAGRIIIYTAGVAANGDGGTNGDGASFTELKLDEEGTVGTDDFSDISDYAVQVFSNPINEILKVGVTSHKSSEVKIDLMSASGSLLKTEKLNLIQGENRIFSMEVGDMESGLYFLRFFDGRKLQSKKILKL